MIKCRIGQKVFSTGDSSFCDPSWETVTDIQGRYDDITGIAYELIICGRMKYRSDTGTCVGGATAYYLSGDVKD